MTHPHRGGLTVRARRPPRKTFGLWPAVAGTVILAAILFLAALCTVSDSQESQAPPPLGLDSATPAPPANSTPIAITSATATATPPATPTPAAEPTSAPDDTLTPSPSPPQTPPPIVTPTDPELDNDYDVYDDYAEPATHDDSELEAAERPAEQRFDGYASCGTKLDYFSYSPVALTDFMGLVPLGNLAPSGHTFPTDHMYFHINRLDIDQWELGTVSVPVVSPGNILITSVTFSEALSLDPPVSDFVVRFSPCQEIHAFFIHMASLSDRLMTEIGTNFDRCEEYSVGGGDFRNCEIRGLRIGVPAGEIIGTAGGNQYANALDLGVYDLRTPPLPYANPSRWEDRSLHIACPLDYFVADVRAALQQRLGEHDNTGLRTIEPFCGEVEQDEPGTAQGVWIAEGTVFTYPEDPHLSLVRDNIDPSISVFSVGTGIGASGLEFGLYYFTPLDTGFINRAFRDVIPGEVYCYENLTLRFDQPSGVNIILEMPTPTTLRIQRIPTPCATGPWTLTDLATNFQR